MHAPSLWGLERSEPARIVAARSPFARGIFDVGIENVAAPKNANSDAVRSSPFVNRAGVEEPKQQVVFATLADEFAGRRKGIV